MIWTKELLSFQLFGTYLSKPVAATYGQAEFVKDLKVLANMGIPDLHKEAKGTAHVSKWPLELNYRHATTLHSPLLQTMTSLNKGLLCMPQCFIHIRVTKNGLEVKALSNCHAWYYRILCIAILGRLQLPMAMSIEQAIRHISICSSAGTPCSQAV